MPTLRPEYLNADERAARARIANARRNRRQPRAEDLRLLASAQAERPVRRLAAAIAKLPPERRARVAELVAQQEEEGAAARSA
jgi:hypothetical protein